MSAEPKFDYDSPEFYMDIEDYAKAGMGDGEIATALTNKKGEHLEPATFGRMKNGNYTGWTKEENEIRSQRICRILTRARNSVNVAMKGSIIKLALGKAVTTTKTTTSKHIVTKNGEVTDDVEVATTDVQTTLPPSLQAAATWLHHHVPEWRQYDNHKVVDDSEDSRVEGISINVAYNKKEDLELQGKRQVIEDDTQS